MPMNVHKVFVSYHHENDQKYRDRFEEILRGSEISIVRSVQIGDIDPNLKTDTIRQKIRDEYLRDTTVTIVLIGKETWKRKHVDWEIGSTLRDTQLNPRGGLVGILLPTYPLLANGNYSNNTIPPRLYDNRKIGYADIYLWTENPSAIQKMIHVAFERRNKIIPDNSRLSFGHNRAGDYWTE